MDRKSEDFHTQRRQSLQGFTNKIDRQPGGEIKYPVVVSAGLRILSFGIIDQRPVFHSNSNIYPIGSKSVRNHQSTLKLGGRTDYTNEIFEGQTADPCPRRPRMKTLKTR
jgi:hypothetical protein